ncbi:MAG TPA: hypothetical protein VFX60_07665 [Micromonospora sp.]|nr:hypothetical protein [Micromonospora sp.]
MTSPDAILLGGPRDGTLFTAGETGVVELEIGGLMQRYLRTRSRQEHNGRSVTVFVYDGAASPTEPRL